MVVAAAFSLLLARPLWVLALWIAILGVAFLGRSQTRWPAMVLGAVLLVVGTVGVLMAGDDDTGDAAAASATVTSGPTATTATPSTTVASTTTTTTTTSTTTTTTTPSTTVASTSTTTTTLPLETVEEFALEFAAALERGDAAFVFDRLHPVVLATYDEASCRATVQNQIMLITAYRLAGPVTGPESVDFTVSDRVITASELFRAPVTSIAFFGCILSKTNPPWTMMPT